MAPAGWHPNPDPVGGRSASIGQMQANPLARNVANLMAGAILLASAACGSSAADPAGSGGSSAAVGGAGSQSTAGVSNSGRAPLTSGGSGGGPAVSSSGRGGETAAGFGPVAGAAGSQSGSAVGSGGSSGSGSGGVSGSGGSAGSGTSGSGGSAGAPVYSTDPKTFGGQPRCEGFEVCESFETTDVGTLPAGFTLEGYGTRKVGVSADKAMRGARSLKLQIDAQSAVTAWLTRKALGKLSAQHFGRAFVRIDGPAPTEFVHFDLFEGTGPYQGHTNAVRYASTGTGVGKSSANWSFIYNVQPSGNGAGSEFGSEGNRSAHPRVDDWMCLEWSFDSAKQVAQYYLDGNAIDYLRITDHAEVPAFDSLAVGVGKYQNTGALLVYLDELAFDGDRIGCNN